ncbi:MAG: hypothetical protein HC919_08660 [Oscillatoriales cyanobacterium SM2_2_1]|nr:hypothetical protein [Oscillatoriales cyanobacterium SM2_2_1]
MMDAIAKYCQDLIETCFPEEVVVQVIGHSASLLVILNRPEEHHVDQQFACQELYGLLWQAIYDHGAHVCNSLTICCRLLGEVQPEWEVSYLLEIPASDVPSYSHVSSLDQQVEEEEFTFEEIISQADDTAFGIVPEILPSAHSSFTMEEEATVIQSYRNSLIAQFEAEAADLVELPLELPAAFDRVEVGVEASETASIAVGEGIAQNTAEVTSLGDQVADEAVDGDILVLSHYCFIRNRSLLRADLPQPREGVARRLTYFVDLSDTEKRLLLPTLDQFFRDPKRTAIAELPDGWRDWLGEIKNADDEVFRSMAIWLSRYCAQPEETVAVLRQVLTAAEAEETIIQEASQRAIAQMESTLTKQKGRGKTQGINVSIQRTFALPDDSTELLRGEPFQTGFADDSLPSLAPRLWASWLSYVFWRSPLRD